MGTFAAEFEAFLAADEILSITSAFSTIKTISHGSKSYSYLSLREFAIPLLSYKRRSLFGVFDSKIAACEPFVVSQTRSKHIVVSGAGPVGLRSACEAAALGFKVKVIELRSEFSRHNVIKTWNCTITDLQSLGLSHFYPQFAGNNHGTLHLGIKEIQVCLLKAALILGVNFEYETGVCGIVDPVVLPQEWHEKKWAVWTLPAQDAKSRLKTRADIDGISTEVLAPELALQPGEQNLERLDRKNRVDYFEPASSKDGAVICTLDIASGTTLAEQQVFKDANMITEALSGIHTAKAALTHFDYFIVAEGESSRLIRHLGFDRKVWKFANMIGIVANFDISPDAQKNASSPERCLPEFVVARMDALWRQGPLGQLDSKGYSLENLEYMRGSKTHFFVCTIKKETLLSTGIVRTDAPIIPKLLAYANLNLEKLENFARELANSAGVPSSCEMSKRHGVQIFDFSCKGQCVDMLRSLKSSAELPSALVLPVGDALQNPYWPQGLGINRGFHSAFDAVHSAYIDATVGEKEAVYERVTSFRAMDWYPLQEALLVTPRPKSAKVKAATGNSPEHNWTIDPVSRYSRRIYKSIHLNDINTGARSPSLPLRIRIAHALEWNSKEGEVPADEEKVN